MEWKHFLHIPTNVFFKKKINEGRFLIKADADPSCPWCRYMFCCCCGCCYLIWAFIYLCISPWQQEIAALISPLELGEQKKRWACWRKMFLSPISLLPRWGSNTSFLGLSPPPALVQDTKAKPCCLLLSVLFTDANPLCSSSRVSLGIKCALW